MGKPIIITETGLPDGVDSRRELWATSYLKVARSKPLRHPPALGHVLAAVTCFVHPRGVVILNSVHVATLIRSNCCSDKGS